MADDKRERINSSFVHPPSFENVDGVIHSPNVTKEFLSQIKDLPVQPNDVFIASYPKSGKEFCL